MWSRLKSKRLAFLADRPPSEFRISKGHSLIDIHRLDLRHNDRPPPAVFGGSPVCQAASFGDDVPPEIGQDLVSR
jgi:hypothetical protein